MILGFPFSSADVIRAAGVGLTGLYGVPRNFFMAFSFIGALHTAKAVFRPAYRLEYIPDLLPCQMKKTAVCRRFFLLHSITNECVELCKDSLLGEPLGNVVGAVLIHDADADPGKVAQDIGSVAIGTHEAGLGRVHGTVLGDVFTA